MASKTMKLLKEEQGATASSLADVTEEQIEALNSKAINAFVKEHGIKIDGWSKANLATKKETLKGYVLKMQAKAQAEELGLTAKQIDAMSAKDVIKLHRQLVEDEKIEAIDKFSSLLLADKKAAMKSALGLDLVEEEEAESVEETESAAESAAEPAAAPAKEAKPAAKTKVTTVAHPPEILPPDEISKVELDLSKLTESEAPGLVRALMEQGEYTAFYLGGALSRILEDKWFEGHPDFRTCIEVEYGLQYRKAMYLVKIHRSVRDAGIPWSTVKKLGWTKMRTVVSMIEAQVVTADNVDKWSKKLAGLTAVQVQELARSEIDKKQSKTTTKPPASNVMTMTFKVHDDQKANIDAALERAMKESNTEHRTVGLEAICIAYMSGPPVKGKTLAEIFGELSESGPTGLNTVFEEFEKAWPDVEVNVKLPKGMAAE